MNVTETRQTEGSMPSKDAPNYYGGQGGSARADVGVGFFLAISAIIVASFAAGAVFVGLLMQRDQVASVRGDVIELEGRVKDLEIITDELKNRRD